jgi:hypothetical protein
MDRTAQQLRRMWFAVLCQKVVGMRECALRMAPALLSPSLRARLRGSSLRVQSRRQLQVAQPRAGILPSLHSGTQVNGARRCVSGSLARNSHADRPFGKQSITTSPGCLQSPACSESADAQHRTRASAPHAALAAAASPLLRTLRVYASACWH